MRDRSDDGERGAVPAAPRDPAWRHHGSLHSRTIEWDPELRRRTVYWYDSASREQFVTEHWDVQPIVEHNKALYAQTDERAPWRDDPRIGGTHFATIPLAIAIDWMKKTNNGKDRAAVRRLIMDPDNAIWRVRPIRYGV